MKPKVVLLKRANAPMAVLRASANSGIELAFGIITERKETNCRIVCARGDTEKGVLPFCRVASRVASVRRRTDRYYRRQKRKTAKRQEYCCECDVSIVHRLLCFVLLSLINLIRSSYLIYIGLLLDVWVCSLKGCGRRLLWRGCSF